jgi:hypothetical protein
MLKQKPTVIRLVAASSRRPLRISAAVSKNVLALIVDLWIT